MSDKEFMNLALQLALKGSGFVNPNPMVGAVIVKKGQIIGQGYHEFYGGLHAERNAINACSQSPEGATLYVTMEPCCHFGKTPPCTLAILESGISRVVVGSDDPNPLVAGKGLKQLKKHGIQVTRGVLKEECDRINQSFFYFITSGKPYVVMKYAMTMDGKIAAYTGRSKWITGEKARENVHQDRRRYSAVMAGVGTVLADDPLFTCRTDGGKNPLRIICDTRLRTPFTSKIVATAREVPTLIATACTDEEKQKPYAAAGISLLLVEEKEGHLNLGQLMTKLGAEKVDSILLEGGGTLNWSALEEGIVNKVQAYISPKLFGGATGKTPVGGRGVPDPKEAYFLENSVITSFGEDILIESEVRQNVHGNH